MSPVAINGVDKQGVYVNGVQVKQALNPANETVNKGVYDPTTLSAVDADLATANIKATKTIFGKAGKAEVVDTTTATPVAAARMKTGDEGWANGTKYTGTGTQTLNPANENVPAGYYAATTLSAVDGDLQVGNIKLGETIFGFLGTLAGGGVETIDKHANAVIANNATYTPGVSGIFFETGVDAGAKYVVEYFSAVDTTWHQIDNAAAPFTASNAIGDGANYRIKNKSGGNAEYCLMRHYIDTGTYERARDEDLAGGTAWTPATSGFFSMAGEVGLGGGLYIEIQLTTLGWGRTWFAEENRQASLPIGDGTNLRVWNVGGAAQFHVTMRAVMT